MDQIEVGGDFPLDEVREKTRNFEFCLERIDDYFGADSNLSCTVGTFPEAHSPDYCWGGCPGSLQEAMHIFRGFYPDVDKDMHKVRYVVGKVDGPLNLEDGERVLFVVMVDIFLGWSQRSESGWNCDASAKGGRKTSGDRILDERLPISL